MSRLGDHLSLAAATISGFLPNSIARVDVDVGCGADQVAHPGGADQAGAHPGGEAAPRHGQHRHAHPHGVGRRRVRAVGKGVEEDVGQRIARQMLGIGLLARRRSAGLGLSRAAAAICCRRALVCVGAAEQPQHAVWHLPQNAHPGLEDGGVIFCMPLRQQIDERRRRAGPRPSRGRTLGGNRPPAVVGLVARQPQHLLREVDLVPSGMMSGSAMM